MRSAIYAKVSTESQEKQQTIDSQLSDLRNYASQNNLTIVEEYIDNGYSGELFERPALDKLRDDAKNRLFSVLLKSPVNFAIAYPISRAMATSTLHAALNSMLSLLETMPA